LGEDRWVEAEREAVDLGNDFVSVAGFVPAALKWTGGVNLSVARLAGHGWASAVQGYDLQGEMKS